MMLWILGAIAAAVVFWGISSSFEPKKTPAPVTTSHSVSLATEFHDNSTELCITARQQGPFIMSLTAISTPNNYEFTFFGADCIENVFPIANANYYVIRILIPDDNHRPKEVFEATIYYDASLKKFVFGPE
ncbi:MAG: hypothetical protein HGA33_02835 [Candidatus Moranbacteria bacterium]|nr:hypothetical protein [Candidatus Moranbacteria bacterium]